MKLIDVIEELVEEREIDRSILNSVICEGILAAYKKKYPDLAFQVETDKKTGEINISVEKEIVPYVKDEAQQISLKKARYINKVLKEGDKVWVPFEGKIGRIEILRARQVIANKIRQIEALAVYNEFKGKEGEIVLGVIHKCERGGMIIKIDDVLAFLPRSLSIPEDKCIVGFSIRALLKEVLPEPKNDNQLILDRASAQFLKNLFELEIPEVFEKLVEIKKIVRSPGYKAKVVVASHDRNIDPVGTCIGVGGSRIKPILKELGGEKIDVISWNDSLEMLISEALRPAKINRVELSEDKKTAKAWLDEDQRSLAIGRMGQNISLASRLTNVDIQLETVVKKDKDQQPSRDVDILEIEE